MPEMKELGVVRIASPCRQQWSRMVGDERRRFCLACKRNVYNLTALTSDQARALLSEAEGRLCVRFWARPDGTVITRDCPIGARWKTWKWAALAIAALNFIAAAIAGVWSGISRPADEPYVGPPAIRPIDCRTGGCNIRNFGQNNPY